ncbi:MAG: SDR family oxidoreductase [Rhodothermia bacterium]|nr:MAG: SDR family oxidoreductase [Rhodothermia bacterium]
MGRLFSLVFLGLGARVAAWDVDADGLDRLAESTLVDSYPLGSRLHTYVCDVTDQNSIGRAAGETLRDLKHVDVLLNNAGVVKGNWISELSDEDIEKTFAVNALAPFRITRAFLPEMISRGKGHIVTMASAGGFVGTPKLADYCASKSAAIAFDESLRLEMKHLGYSIKTTLVCPFYVDTGMFTGVKTRFSWLLPILSPEFVVKKTVRAIYKGKKRLIMPRFVFSIFLLRVLPVAWFDGLVSFFGISRSMDEFEGRKNPTLFSDES